MSQSTKPGSVSAATGVGFGASVVVGWLDASSTSEQLRVDFPGNSPGPLAARTTLQLPLNAIAQAVAARQGALLVFENGDLTLPIVIGLIQSAEGSAFSALLGSVREPVLANVPVPALAPTSPSREARVDGQRIVLEAEREIVLKCGEASLTLRRDGKVLIRGAYVETHSKGVHRIKGGAVKIN